MDGTWQSTAGTSPQRQNVGAGIRSPDLRMPQERRGQATSEPYEAYAPPGWGNPTGRPMDGAIINDEKLASVVQVRMTISPTTSPVSAQISRTVYSVPGSG